MDSQLKFFDHKSRSASRCGEVLEIEFSSHGLDWQGIILEKGSSPYFNPLNVYTPYFYFALSLEQDLNWDAETPEGKTHLKTTPGEIWINPPNTPFSHQIDEPCYFIILAIEEDLFLSNPELNHQKETLQFLNNYNVQDETLRGIMELFLVEAKAGGRNGYAYLKTLLSLLSTHYIKNYSNHEENYVSASSFSQKDIDKVDRYIDSNISSPISIDDLSDLLGYGKFYFLREFKKFTHITPYQYLMTKRLEQAKKRLTSNKDTISAIGFDLGFNDQPHFTRAFKNHFGVTPGQFKKQLKPKR